MTRVVDASVVVAALLDDGETGSWAEAVLESDDVAAPHLMHVEVAKILRRVTIGRQVPGAVTSLAYADLLDLRVELYPYEPFADRVWELRDTVTAYDAWYVALAERLQVDFATLDQRLARAVGPKCAFLTPES